jgi:hypothetical protein
MPNNSKKKRPVPVRIALAPLFLAGKVTTGIVKVVTSPLRRR